MPEYIKADATPEKRLFISLITRDIPLVAAFLDLIDNSINAAVEPYADRLLSARDYDRVLHDDSIVPTVEITLRISPDSIEIRDTAPGISAEIAKDHVFKFGRGSNESHSGDRLSVYGVGLKRAIFKLGNKITMRSDHVAGGFDLKLDVAAWAKLTDQPWTFDISPRHPAKAEACGTTITVRELHDEVKRRLADGVFESQLRDTISKTYAFYLAKFVNVFVEKTKVEGVDIGIGTNHTSQEFKVGDVSCSITAGIGTPQGGSFRDRSSGWFVLCNGRSVISADKSALTGWAGAGLPIFQPKHRPFLGTVFFVSRDAEQLPWTTTKSGINEDSAIWQEAKRHMVTVGRAVVSFLDSRYTEEGTEVPSTDLQDVAGPRMSVIAAAVSERRSFVPPKRPPPATTKIQYEAKIGDVKRIEDYLKRPGMGGSAIGRHTFNYFLRNEVGEV
jgi:hypothetical protein